MIFVEGDSYIRNASSMPFRYIIILTPMMSLWCNNNGDMEFGSLNGTIAASYLKDEFVWRKV